MRVKRSNELVQLRRAYLLLVTFIFIILFSALETFQGHPYISLTLLSIFSIWVLIQIFYLKQDLKKYQSLDLQRLLVEKRRADIIAESIPDGIFLIKDNRLTYSNSVGYQMIGIHPPESDDEITLDYKDIDKPSPGLKAVMESATRTLPIEFSTEINGKKYYYLLQSFSLPYRLVYEVEEKIEKVKAIRNTLLDAFQADTIVLAQDVTLMRENQNAKRHFLAALTHEVKTPMTSLTMATRLLKRGVDQVPDSTHQNLILTCADDVDRLRKLIDDLAAVSQFDPWNTSLRLQQVDLKKLMSHAVQSFQVQARQKSINLLYHVRGIGPPILAEVDATKIAWALSNLLMNALKHTPIGGKIEATLEASDGQVEFRIRDTGPGIERGRQRQLFEKLNSNDHPLKSKSRSGGLGLAIAKEIVVSHGGRIWVTSELNHGAEFCFTLPLLCSVSTKSASDKEEDTNRPLSNRKERIQ